MRANKAQRLPCKVPSVGGGGRHFQSGIRRKKPVLYLARAMGERERVHGCRETPSLLTSFQLRAVCSQFFSMKMLRTAELAFG